MLYSLENETMRVSVSDVGAELQSILGADGTEYLWQGDKSYWGRRAINLFPFVGRLFEGRYTLDGTEHKMDIHGFAKTSLFETVEDGASLRFTLCDSAESYEQYPRRFCLSIVYRLNGNRLDIRYEVVNRDERTMYFGLGGHPGFNVPLKAGLAFSDYRISFAEPCRPERVLFTKNGLQSGERVSFALDDGRSMKLRHELFDDDAVVLRGVGHTAAIESDRDPHGVTVSFPQMANVGFWHMPKTDAPYVCIEPWCSLPAMQDEVTAFEKKSDLLSLEPGGQYQNDWYIEIK